MATFNIGQQNAANIQNIGGDSVIHGGIQATASWDTLELRRAIARARDGLGELALPQPVLEDVNRSLEAAANEAARPKPDRHDVAEHLAAATTTLREAGALVDAGTTVVDSLRRAVALLGPIGLALVGAL
ncbi:MAG TPA: hypothetical protein VFT86_04430 [Gaiellaceae bacterium]|nr:hypothetical protein [Gaiellaceae bacterium]